MCGAQYDTLKMSQMEQTGLKWMALGVLALSACAKEEEMPVELPSHRLIAVIENEDSKTYYQEAGSTAVMSWEQGDVFKMIVFDDSSHEAAGYDCTASESGASVAFDFGGDQPGYSRSGYAVYPGLALSGTQDSYRVTLPDTYTLTGTDFTKVRVPMIGVADAMNPDRYTFHTAVGVLKVSLSDLPASASKLVITSNADNLSGVFLLNAEDGLLMSACSGSAGHSITVNFPGQPAGSSIDLYVPVPVGSLSSGACFDVQQSSGASLMQITTQQAITIARNHLTPLSAIGVAGNSWLTLFTDLSYSQLKPGITADDINAFANIGPYYLAENVALPLLNGTYDAGEKEFRIHSYEPYSDIRFDSPALLTRLYSALDNPTGIQVSDGDQLVVCVDQIPAGQDVSLAVYGDAGNAPNFGGTADWTYGMDQYWAEGYDQQAVLHAGINVIDITADGMVYILNTVTQADPYHPSTTPAADYSPVKVHILPGGGSVQGYFEPARHTDARGDELLAACSYKYFMVKGQRCSFLFHTGKLQEYSASAIRSGIEVWDSAVLWQKQLCGIDGLDWFNNHIVVGSTTDNNIHLDASHRRILTHRDNIPTLVSKQALLDNEGGWGAFHEMGHLHQHPINWKSTSESSNNLFSNFCKKKLADQESVSFVSRGAKIGDLADSYADGKPWVMLGEATYQAEDTELHLRMNWQLWNYYHLCGHNSHFFPDLFNYLRDSAHLLPSEYGSWYYWYLGIEDNPGLAQLAYYEACCNVAQEDLTEFFDAWGFFRPVDIASYYQYGYVHYEVTDAMIAESKARIAAKNYPKAAPIQYLEDRGTVGSTKYSELGYYTAFIGEAAAVSSPAAIVMGNAIDANCNNAVAVELREGNTADGQLLFFSNICYFELPAGLSLTGNSLWAVQADGVRVHMTEIEL